MIRLSLLVLLTMFFAFDARSQTKPQRQMITIEEIEQMYSNMKANGINTDTIMLYGYFFTNDDPKGLKSVAAELKSKKFRFVKIYQDKNKVYWLHLERKEVHNSKTLFALDKDLYAIAEKYKLNSYDGFDVGNIDETKPIDRDTYAVPEEFKAIDFIKDGYPFLLVGNVAFDRFPHKEEFCYFIKITCQYKLNDNVMLPSDADLDKLDKFETFIEGGLAGNKVKSYYVFRDTYKGVRNCFLVTNDKDSANKVMMEIKSAGSAGPFGFEIITDKKWKLYEDVRAKFPKD